MHGNLHAFSNFDSFKYYIERTFNKEICLVLLEYMMLVFRKVHVFLSARDVKEKFKAKNKKSKSCSLKAKIKKVSCLKNLNQWIYQFNIPKRKTSGNIETAKLIPAQTLKKRKNSLWLFHILPVFSIKNLF